MARLLSAACVVLTILLAACSTPMPPLPAGHSVVFVIQRGWHTELGFPVAEIGDPLAVLKGPFPGVRFLTFGFGERQFLLNRHDDVGAMRRALLPSKSALLMTALKAPPGQAFGSENVVVLYVSPTDLDTIETSIWHDLELSSAGTAIRVADGPYPGSVLYAARHTYDLLYTCNSWTAGMLRAGGLPMPSTGVLFAGQVMEAAHRIAGQQVLPPRPTVATRDAAKRP